MWERYGFYVVQSLLALYMAMQMGWPDDKVYALVGSFTALTYISPIIGGWIADHLLGQKRSILLGSVFLFFSYILLALDNTRIGLIMSLAGIAVGTGLLKPNISSLLGNEYPKDSLQRENGFTIFYMGITLGIVLGTTLPSILNYYYGWAASFSSAAFGMVVAGSVFLIGVKQYHIKDYYPREFKWQNGVKAIMLIAIIWAISFLILLHPHLADLSFGLVTCSAVAYVFYTYRQETNLQANQTLVIGLLCIISVVFWAFYFQMFLSITLFISRVVEPRFLGILFPPPYYVGLESVGMLVIGYFISRNKATVSSAHSGIKTGNKFILSLLFMVMAYSLITFICHSSHSSNLLSPLLFIPIFLLISVSELLLSPVGLAAVTRLSDRRKVSTMMGIFFVSLGLGAFMSGKIALITAVDDLSSLSLVALKAHYTQTFSTLYLILIGATLVCIVLNRLIKKLLS